MTAACCTKIQSKKSGAKGNLIRKMRNKLDLNISASFEENVYYHRLVNVRNSFGIIETKRLLVIRTKLISRIK